jgi:hypothetical protein
MDSFIGGSVRIFSIRCEFCKVHPNTDGWNMQSIFGVNLEAFKDPNAKITLTRCCDRPVHCDCYGCVRIYLQRCPICREKILIPLSPLLQSGSDFEERYKTYLFTQILSALRSTTEYEEEVLTSSQCIEAINQLLFPSVQEDDIAEDIISEQVIQSHNTLKIMIKPIEPYPGELEQYKTLSNEDLIKKIQKLKAKVHVLEWTNSYLKKTILL